MDTDYSISVQLYVYIYTVAIKVIISVYLQLGDQGSQLCHAVIMLMIESPSVTLLLNKLPKLGCYMSFSV